MLSIRLARKGEIEFVQSVYMESGELQEFVMQEGIKNRIAENLSRPGVWIAETDLVLPREFKRSAVKESEVDGFFMVGAANIGSRHSYPHLIRHGEVAVAKDYRRHGIGTALYFAEIAQSILEGRREAEDTIVGTNVNMHHFLPSLGYREIGRLEERTSGFQDIVLYSINTLVAFKIYMDHIKEKWNDVNIYLMVTDTVLRDRERNFEAYRKHKPQLVEKLTERIDLICNHPWFVVMDATVQLSLPMTDAISNNPLPQ